MVPPAISDLCRPFAMVHQALDDVIMPDHSYVSHLLLIRHRTYSSGRTPPHRPWHSSYASTRYSSTPRLGTKRNRHTTAGGSGSSGARPYSGVGSVGSTWKRICCIVAFRKCRHGSADHWGRGVDAMLLISQRRTPSTRLDVQSWY